jgi:hypothetical protein
MPTVMTPSLPVGCCGTLRLFVVLLLASIPGRFILSYSIVWSAALAFLASRQLLQTP